MHHDVGGTDERAPIVRENHPFAAWETRVDAVMWTLTDPTRPGGPQMTVDELRRGIEGTSAEAYRERGYYERWLRSMIAILGERGVVDVAAIERRASELLADHDREHA